MNVNKTMLDIVLPFAIFSFIAIIYILNKQTTVVKNYFHALVIPLVGLLSARKSISQNDQHYYINGSFASWLVMIVYTSFISPLEWHKTAFINLLSFMMYFAIVKNFYGVIDNDFFIHVPTAFLLITQLVKMNEFNNRMSFNLLYLSK